VRKENATSIFIFIFVSISILILVLVCRRGLPSSPDQQLSIARSAKRVIF
jgi:hypothetical protein